MVALRLVGCVLIVASGYVISRTRLKRDCTKVERLRSLLALLRAIGSRIENYCMPTDEILTSVPSELIIGCGYSAERLPSSVGELLEECPFSDDGEVYGFLCTFLSSLGTSYKSDELARCRLACEEVSAMIERRCAENGKRQKTLPVLCLCASAAIAIIIF